MADGDLLAPIVPDDQQHRSFRLLTRGPGYAPARDLLRDVWAALPNPDDNFVREFQTRGFDARVWELALFAVGHFGPYQVTRPSTAPDFRFEWNGLGVWIEAVTSNPSATLPAWFVGDRCSGYTGERLCDRMCWPLTPLSRWAESRK